MSRVISRPTGFVVEDYAPAFAIDFRSPADTTDLDGVRESADLDSWQGLPFDALMQRADETCRKLQVSDADGDFIESIQRFGGHDELRRSLAATAQTLADTVGDASPLEQVRAVLLATGVVRRAEHFAVSLCCHDPQGSTELPADGTHFGYALDGEPLELLLPDGRRYAIHPGTYLCVPGSAVVTGRGRMMITTRHGYRGLFSIGGAVEPWGRLQYIDGCTDTVLVPPVRQGDPCLNALYFPPRTKQTLHVHPSLRAGVVIAGRGTCKTPTGDHPLEPGKVFFLPPETWHAFHTDAAEGNERAALTVLAFHPDSDSGPTDEEHPMLNRTYFRFFHRLRSVQRRKHA